MGRTLLIGNPRTTWREWLKANREHRDLLCLDPSDTQQGLPGRVALFKGEHPAATRFYGALDPQRAPHVLVAALAEMLPQMGDHGIIQLFPYRAGPLMRQVAMLCAEISRPDRVLIASETEIESSCFTSEVEVVELEDAPSAHLQAAQRKAQWLRLI
jgi:hypothetical protein